MGAATMEDGRRTGRRAAVAGLLAALAVLVVIFSVDTESSIHEDVTSRLLKVSEDHDTVYSRSTPGGDKQAIARLRQSVRSVLQSEEPKKFDFVSRKIVELTNAREETMMRGRELMHKSLMKRDDEEDEDEDNIDLVETSAGQEDEVDESPTQDPTAVVKLEDLDAKQTKALLDERHEKRLQQVQQQLDKASRAPTTKLTQQDTPLSEAKVAQKAASEAKNKYFEALKEMKKKKSRPQARVDAQTRRTRQMILSPRTFDFHHERQTKVQKATEKTAKKRAKRKAARKAAVLLQQKKHDDELKKMAQIEKDKADEKNAKQRLARASHDAITDMRKQEKKES